MTHNEPQSYVSAFIPSALRAVLEEAGIPYVIETEPFDLTSHGEPPVEASVVTRAAAPKARDEAR